jgi:small subunit ribosomal protein S8
MQHDPLSDAMSAVKNAEKFGKSSCHIAPASKLILNVLKVMRENGYIGDIELISSTRGDEIAVDLVGAINTCGVIKPRNRATRSAGAISSDTRPGTSRRRISDW